MVTLQVRNLRNRRTEAGRTYHCAICTGQTTLRYTIPARMFKIDQKQIANTIGIHVFADLIDRTLPLDRGGLQMSARSRLMNEFSKHRGSIV